MNRPVALCCLVVAPFLSNCLAQDDGNVATRPATRSPFERADPTQNSMKIVMEDGTPPPVELQVVPTGVCLVTRVFGNGTVTFSWPGPPVNGNAGPQSVGASEAPVRNDGNVTYGPLGMPHVGEFARGEHVVAGNGGCTALVMAPGLRSQHVSMTRGRQIILQRLGEHEGSTISFTVLKAPPEAKKAYAKGAEALQKKKYAEARKQFEEAIKIYPEYAVAWSQLGRALILMGKRDEARSALKEAIRLDKMYITPLVQLAGLEADAERWPECVQASDAAIALKAVEFPGAYYYRALAHLQAREWNDAARRSEEATKIDSRLEYPRAYVVLAMSMDKRGDRRGAADALRHFLTLSPGPKEADWARAYLSKLEP